MKFHIYLLRGTLLIKYIISQFSKVSFVIKGYSIYLNDMICTYLVVLLHQYIIIVVISVVHCLGVYALLRIHRSSAPRTTEHALQ